MPKRLQKIMQSLVYATQKEPEGNEHFWFCLYLWVHVPWEWMSMKTIVHNMDPASLSYIQKLINKSMDKTIFKSVTRLE